MIHLWLDALQAVYIASCLACRHTAVRFNALTGKHECDWCRMTVQETRMRIFLRRLRGEA